MVGNFGFIHEKLDIKILILFILRRLSEPIPIGTLTELTMCDDGIVYFDFMECVSELVSTDHIRFENKKYSITKKGERNGEITENSLPYSVRMLVENSTFKLRSKQSRSSLIETSHTTKPDGGFSVALSLSDGVGVIASMELFASSEHYAQALEDGFRKNAENTYNAIIGTILSEPY